MVHGEDSDLDEMFPLPPGIRLRPLKCGSNPVSPVIPLPSPGELARSDPERAALVLHHADDKLGVRVEVREVRESGRLVAYANCTDARLLGKGAVSAVLFAPNEGPLIGKTIPLNTPELHGCSGSADFGKFADVAKELGASMGVVVFLLT